MIKMVKNKVVKNEVVNNEMVMDEMVIKEMVLNKMVVINGTVVYKWSSVNRFMLWYIYEVLKYIFVLVITFQQSFF